MQSCVLSMLRVLAFHADLSGTLSLYVDGILRASKMIGLTSFQHGDGAPLSIFRRAGSSSNLAHYAASTDALTGELQKMGVQRQTLRGGVIAEWRAGRGWCDARMYDLRPWWI